MIFKNVLLTALAIAGFALANLAQTNVTYNWAWKSGGWQHDEGHAIGIDSAGGVFTLGGGKDNTNFFSANQVQMIIRKNNQLGAVVATASYSVPYTDNLNYYRPNNMVVDHNGNVFVTGTFNGTLDFDPGTAVYNVTGDVYASTFLLKLDNNLNFVFVKISEINVTGEKFGMAVDESNNLILAGSFVNTVDFDLNSGIFNLTAEGYDSYIAKYDNNGNFIWAKDIGNNYITWEAQEFITSTVVDSIDNIYICGYFDSPATTGIDLDPGSGTYFVNNIDASGNHVPLQFTVKLDNNGNFIWGKSILLQANSTSPRISVDNMGNVFCADIFSGTVDFDPSINVYNLTGPYNSYTNKNQGVFITKLDSNGLFKWAKTIGIGTSAYSSTAKNFYNPDIELDLQGNIYISHPIRDTVDCDPGVGIYNISSESLGNTFAITKLATNGDFIWAGKLFESNGVVGIESFVINNNHELFVTGYFGCTVDFDPSAATNALTSIGTTGCLRDIFTAKYGTIALDIDESKKTSNSIKIFPNPSNGLYELQLNDSEIDNINLTVNDVLGKTVLKTKITNTNTKIDLSSHPNGIYFIEIEKVNQAKYFIKIIKQ